MDPIELIDEYIKKDQILQVYEEILTFAYWVKGFSPNNILEIGTHLGATFRILNEYSTGKKVSVDIEERVHGILSEFMYKEDWKFFCGSSLTDEMFENVKSFCEQYDIIFIDGDHTYDGVKRDFELYKSLLSPRGYVVFHDMCPNHVYDKQVYQFWKDIEDGSKMELVCSKSTGKIKSGPNLDHYGGIGLWRPY